jgi:hypothetical protein
MRLTGTDRHTVEGKAVFAATVAAAALEDTTASWREWLREEVSLEFFTGEC